MRIYIAGPYTASSEAETLRNVHSAIDAGIILFRKGHVPYIPHLTHFIAQRAEQEGIEITHEEWVRDWDAPWLEVCEALLLLDHSPGATEELKMAERLGKVIFFGSADCVPDEERTFHEAGIPRR